MHYDSFKISNKFLLLNRQLDSNDDKTIADKAKTIFNIMARALEVLSVLLLIPEIIAFLYKKSRKIF